MLGGLRFLPIYDATLDLVKGYISLHLKIEFVAIRVVKLLQHFVPKNLGKLNT